MAVGLDPFIRHKGYNMLTMLFSFFFIFFLQGAVITPAMDPSMSMQPASMMGPLTQQMNHLSLGTTGSVSPPGCFEPHLSQNFGADKRERRCKRTAWVINVWSKRCDLRAAGMTLVDVFTFHSLTKKIFPSSCVNRPPTSPSAAKIEFAAFTAVGFSLIILDFFWWTDL